MEGQLSGCPGGLTHMYVGPPVMEGTESPLGSTGRKICVFRCKGKARCIWNSTLPLRNPALAPAVAFRKPLEFLTWGLGTGCDSVWTCVSHLLLHCGVHLPGSSHGVCFLSSARPRPPPQATPTTSKCMLSSLRRPIFPHLHSFPDNSPLVLRLKATVTGVPCHRGPFVVLPDLPNLGRDR